MFEHEFTNFTTNDQLQVCCNFANGRAPTPQSDDDPGISPDLGLT